MVSRRSAVQARHRAFCAPPAPQRPGGRTVRYVAAMDPSSEQVDLDQCTPLDAVADMAAREADPVLDHDEVAMQRLAGALARTPSGRQMSEARRLAAAESLYAAFCHRVLHRQVSRDELTRMAELVGEPPQQLRDRLMN